MEYNFTEVPSEFFEYATAKVAILSVPYEGTVTYGKGTSFAPSAIINASKNLEWYDEEIEESPYKVGIYTANPLEVAKDDWPEEVISRLDKSCSEFLAANKFVIVLGGEHSISLGFFNALKKKYPDLSVLQLDAHADLRGEYDGTKYSHACVIRRIREECKNVVQVGIRSLSEEEAELIKKERCDIFYAKDIIKDGDWMDKAISKLGNNVFITFDVDVFDPALVPDTGTPEPGGLGWYTILEFLKKVFKKKNVVGVDVVELAPKGNVGSDFTIAKLVYKMVGYKFFKNKL